MPEALGRFIEAHGARPVTKWVTNLIVERKMRGAWNAARQRLPRVEGGGFPTIPHKPSGGIWRPKNVGEYFRYGVETWQLKSHVRALSTHPAAADLQVDGGDTSPVESGLLALLTGMRFGFDDTPNINLEALRCN